MSGEPEIRIDQLTGLRTVLAPGRADRPFEWLGAPEPDRDSSDCPLCEGQEDKTPSEVGAWRPDGGKPDSPGWSWRAVPNLYPAFIPSQDGEGIGGVGDAHASHADPLRASARGAEPDMFSSRPAQGAHEVIVHTPRHVRFLSELEEGELATALGAWRERLRAHADWASRTVIVNEGPAAGASLEHTHAQLYALPFVPPEIARERERFTAYHERTMGGELLSDLAAEEVRRGERLVAVDEDAMLVCPWASRSPYELRVIPRQASTRFEDDDDAGTGMLGVALRALERRFGGPPQLNLWVRTAPRRAEHFHWHVDVAPRIGVKAGFELSTGVDINIMPPERAAAELREALDE